MKRKIVLGIVITVFAAVLIYTVMVVLGFARLPAFARAWFDKPEELSDNQKIIKTVTESYPTDVLVYGDYIDFEDGFPVRYIESWDKDAVTRGQEYRYTVVIINDLENRITLSEEEQGEIGELTRTDGYCIIYLGEKYSSVWNEKNGRTGTISIDDNLCSVYYTKNKQLRRSIGAWTENEKTMFAKDTVVLGTTLMSCIQEYIVDMQ